MQLFKNGVVKVFAVKKCRRAVFLATNYGLFSFKSIYDISLCPEVGDVVIDDLSFMHQDKDEEHLFLATEGKGVSTKWISDSGHRGI